MRTYDVTVALGIGYKFTVSAPDSVRAKYEAARKVKEDFPRLTIAEIASSCVARSRDSHSNGGRPHLKFPSFF